MAHGTPSDESDVEAFYTRIRRGRPPSPEQLADLRARYRAIGGASPLNERTQAQVEGLRRALDARTPGRFVVRFGAKHTEPLIEEAAGDLVRPAGAGGRRADEERADEGRAGGRRRVPIQADPPLAGIVGLVLTPHQSSMGSDEYLERAAQTVAPSGTPLVSIRSWYEHPALIELWAERVKAALEDLSPGPAVVVFTAHSLPERIRQVHDPYEAQVEASAALVAAAAGLGDAWRVAWQSPGRTPEPWIGPDVLEVIRSLGGGGAGGADAADRPGETEARLGEAVRAVVVCPVGFVADHLEVLYDLDVEARGVAEDVGLRFARTASLNDEPRFIEALADVVIRSAQFGPRADAQGVPRGDGESALSTGSERFPGIDAHEGRKGVENDPT
jgi:protoporphyrin/coproporphyrin ferrochelatase